MTFPSAPETPRQFSFFTDQVADIAVYEVVIKATLPDAPVAGVKEDKASSWTLTVVNPSTTCFPDIVSIAVGTEIQDFTYWIGAASVTKSATFVQTVDNDCPLVYTISIVDQDGLAVTGQTILTVDASTGVISLFLDDYLVYDQQTWTVTLKATSTLSGNYASNSFVARILRRCWDTVLTEPVFTTTTAFSVNIWDQF